MDDSNRITMKKIALRRLLDGVLIIVITVGFLVIFIKETVYQYNFVKAFERECSIQERR